MRHYVGRTVTFRGPSDCVQILDIIYEQEELDRRSALKCIIITFKRKSAEAEAQEDRAKKFHGNAMSRVLTKCTTE